MPDPAAYELAYVEARRALEDQREDVNDLRSRAGVLVAAAALTTSFFGGAALADGALGVAGWIAVALFLGLGSMIVGMVWPRPQRASVLDAKVLIAAYVEADDPAELAEIHRDLALHMAGALAANGAAVASLRTALEAASALLVVEVAAWIAALIAQGA